MLAVLTFSGLWAAKKLGLGAPSIEALLRGDPAPKGGGRAVLMSIALGLGSALLLVALDLFVFLPLGGESVDALVGRKQPPAWIGLLASVEGGVTEEVELRLFLLSFLALGIAQARRVAVRAPTIALTASVFWIANVVTAIVFGLGHLPVTARLVALTPAIVVRAIVLNGIVGVTAGYLFWRRGIELAMVAHFSADIVLHVVVPLVR
jgi:membrane protease YdiL (CAAX protease family)